MRCTTFENFRESCKVPRDLLGTDYSALNCTRTPDDCVSKKKKNVKVTCSPGYVLPESTNVSTVLACPSSNWDRSLIQCLRKLLPKLIVILAKRVYDEQRSHNCFLFSLRSSASEIPQRTERRGFPN